MFFQNNPSKHWRMLNTSAPFFFCHGFGLALTRKEQ